MSESLEENLLLELPETFDEAVRLLALRKEHTTHSPYDSVTYSNKYLAFKNPFTEEVHYLNCVLCTKHETGKNWEYWSYDDAMPKTEGTESYKIWIELCLSP
jgi:hypothetical protein